MTNLFLRLLAKVLAWLVRTGDAFDGFVEEEMARNKR